MLSSLRNGSRRHAAYLPDIAALHCSIELKLQFRAKHLRCNIHRRAPQLAQTVHPVQSLRPMSPRGWSCFQHGGGGHQKPLSPRLRCVPFDPRAKFQHDDALENGHAAPAREITSRHGVDKRSLLPLAAVARNALSRVALEADVFILKRLLCRNQCCRGLHNWCRESRVGSSERSSYMAYEKGKKARGPPGSFMTCTNKPNARSQPSARSTNGSFSTSVEGQLTITESAIADFG